MFAVDAITLITEFLRKGLCVFFDSLVVRLEWIGSELDFAITFVPFS